MIPKADITMAAVQCEGRLVRDAPKGEWMLPFEGGDTWFHVPIRCDRMGVVGGLCTSCYERDVRTQKKAEEMKGTAIGAMHPSLLHGRVGEPVPFWSHIVGGAWFNLKLEAGYRVNEAVMARAKKAVEAAEGVGVVIKAAPAPTGLGRRGRKPKAAAAVAPPAATAIEAPAPAKVAAAAAAAPAPAPPTVVEQLRAAPVAPAAVAPAPLLPAAKPAPKKRGPKKATGATQAATAVHTPLQIATAYVETTSTSPVDDIVEISVQRLELDEGRSYYLDPKKQKVYDMKFKYVGRYSAEQGLVNRSCPDSEAED